MKPNMLEKPCSHFQSAATPRILTLIQGQMVQVRSIKRMAQRLLKKNRIKHNSNFKKENNILDKNCDFNATRYEHLKVIY